jgi:hypothetical protein
MSIFTGKITIITLLELLRMPLEMLQLSDKKREKV